MSIAAPNRIALRVLPLVAGSRVLLVTLVMTLLVSACGSSGSGSRSAAERQAEAQRLRQGLPGEVTLEAAGAGAVAEAQEAAPAPVFEVARVAAADGPEAALLLGEFRLDAKKPVVDGDTVKVEGLDATLRLVGLDAEETLKGDEARRAAASDFAAYALAKRGDSPFPVKYGTPMGEEAKAWAADFFSGHGTVRLEYDEAERQKGFYGRYLVYIFVQKEGEWVNYNVEAVRAGMAPYFAKYGFSRRFHDEFVRAQDEARAAGRGIWSPHTEHYPDYDERLAWWTRRGEAVATFQREYGEDESYFELGVDSEWERMASWVGKPVTVFGTVGSVRLDESPYIVSLSHKQHMDFSVVAFDRPTLETLDLARFEGEYIYVRGELSMYRDRYQFKADTVEQVWTE